MSVFVVDKLEKINLVGLAQPRGLFLRSSDNFAAERPRVIATGTQSLCGEPLIAWMEREGWEALHGALPKGISESCACQRWCQLLISTDG